MSFRQLAAHKMLQVKMGHPKNKQLLRLMETGEWRKLVAPLTRYVLRALTPQRVEAAQPS